MGENKIDMEEKKLVKLGTDGQYDLCAKTDKKASSGRHVRPAYCKAFYCFKCTKEEKESMMKRTVVSSRERERDLAQWRQQQHLI